MMMMIVIQAAAGHFSIYKIYFFTTLCSLGRIGYDQSRRRELLSKSRCNTKARREEDIWTPDSYNWPRLTERKYSGAFPSE